jgi:dihydropteroate synthase
MEIESKRHQQETFQEEEKILPFPAGLGKNEFLEALKKLRVHPYGIELMLPKCHVLPLKIKAVDPRGANILKQEMLGLGGDAAVPEDVFSFAGNPVDVILIGTRKHYGFLAGKLRHQPFGLKAIGKSLKAFLTRENGLPEALKLGGRLFRYKERTLIMGVLNVTPDSFSDGGRYVRPDDAVARGLALETEGADIIDIGGESTRPGAGPVSADEETGRVLPVIRGIRAKSSVPISIDTTKAAVAREALAAGADMVNDISGFTFDPALPALIAEADVPCVVMHTSGRPAVMQEHTAYDDLLYDIVNHLKKAADLGRSLGIGRDRIIVDPGIGFGKTPRDSMKLLKNLQVFQSLGYPVLVGPSRKSFLGAVLNVPAESRLHGTAASVAIAVWNGAALVRVHDVREMKQVVMVADAIKKSAAGERSSRN